MAVWEHERDENTPLDELGDPLMFVPLSQFGIDFVPFTRVLSETPITNGGEVVCNTLC